MLQSAQPSTDAAPEETADETADRRIARRSEELHLRNFDVSREHTLTVRVSDDDGLVFANRYYLTPGKTVSELGRISPGEYEVRVELDGRRQQTATCEIGETPSKTALVEVGNGTVSLTEGLYR